MPAASWSLTARWIFPVAQPPLEGGIVRIMGDCIAGVEPAGTGSADLDLGNVAVLPGLVNAHVHLDLTGMAGLAPPEAARTADGRLDFPGWLRRVIAHRRQRTAEQVRADVAAGLAECIRSGTTLLADISGDGGSWEALAASGIRAVVFRELLGLPEERAKAAWQVCSDWLARHPSRDTCRVGISPHAPYSVHRWLYQQSAAAGVPLATHLAETADELQLLAEHAGPFVPFLEDVGAWAPEGLAGAPGEVIEWCRRARTLLVHGNYLDPELAIPDTATVVYCPRTHAAFGHPPHPIGRFLARGVRVALGTDSRASNPDLNLLAEARFLRHNAPELSPSSILRLATLAGAEALGWADEVGSLEPGKSADLVVVALPAVNDDDPHDRVLAADGPVVRVMGCGRWLSGA